MDFVFEQLGDLVVESTYFRAKEFGLETSNFLFNFNKSLLN